MFSQNRTYRRRISSVLNTDKISENALEQSHAIDSYKPSKYTSLTDTLIESIGEEEYFNYSNDSSYSFFDESDLELLNFSKDTVIEEGLDFEDKANEQQITSSNNNKLFKKVSFLVLVAIIIIVILTLVH